MPQPTQGSESDLDQVATPADLAAMLEALRLQAGFESKRSLTTSAVERQSPIVLAKSTVDDVLAGRRVPTVATLRAFLAVCGVTDEVDIDRWLRAAETARRGNADRPDNAVRVNEADPRLLGVHKTITVDGATGDLPIYVGRDIDAGPTGLRAQVEAAAEGGGFVLMVGGSSVGKTRCAYEAIRELLPGWWLVHPDSAAEVRDLAAAPPRRTVVWLDEIQKLLDVADGVTAGTIRALRRAQSPVVVIGTLWPDWYSRWTVAAQPGCPDPHRGIREVLELANVINIPDRLGISPAERARVDAAADVDPRIRAAAAISGYGLTQTLAAAPQLVERWNHADPYAKAVLAAAVGATHLGVRSPLTADLLRAAAPGYCDERDQRRAPGNWFETALAHATETLHGATAALDPIGPGMTSTCAAPVGYMVADYLLQHVGRQRLGQRVPATVWDAFVAHVADSEDLTRLGESAQDRLLYRHARLFYRRSAAAGDENAAERLAALLAEQGDIETLRTWADAGDRYAVDRLVKVLAEQGDIEKLRAWTDAGHEYAAERLADLLAEKGDATGAIALLRNRADAGNAYAAERLARLLADHGYLAELRARADAGDGSAEAWLADLLAEQGDLAELRARANVGNGYTAGRAAKLLVLRGDISAARALLRTKADAGDAYAADLLAEHCGLAELRVRADAGDEFAAGRLADRLAGKGDAAGAIAVLRRRADNGDVNAAYRLVKMLGEQGDIDALQARADAGDLNARSWLVERAAMQDDQVRQPAQPAAIGYVGTRTLDHLARRLADFLAEQGDIVELRARVDAGDRHSADRLADALATVGHADDADRVRRFGLEPDGRIGGPHTADPADKRA